MFSRPKRPYSEQPSIHTTSSVESNFTIKRIRRQGSKLLRRLSKKNGRNDNSCVESIAATSTTDERLVQSKNDKVSFDESLEHLLVLDDAHVDGPAEQTVPTEMASIPALSQTLPSPPPTGLSLSRKVSKIFNTATVRRRRDQFPRVDALDAFYVADIAQKPLPPTVRIVTPPLSPTTVSSSPLDPFSDVSMASVASPSTCTSTRSLDFQGRGIELNAKEHYPMPTIVETQYSSRQTVCSSTLALDKSVQVMEKVSAVKVFLETYYTSPQFSQANPRSLRQTRMESAMIATHRHPREQARVRQRFFKDESDHLRESRILKSRHSSQERSLALAGYEAIRVLGKGSFGVVRLVKEKGGEASVGDGQGVYAMKVIHKSEMLRNSQEAHLRAERDFLVASAEKSKWIVPLVTSFQDEDNLYLVMEFAVGGDFLGLLMREGTLSEDESRWYAAEMIMAIEEAHRLRWIHRDIKPDNFLIMASGHLKISDFGLAFDGHWAHTQAYYQGHRNTLMELLGIEIDGDEEDREVARKSSGSHRAPVRGMSPGFNIDGAPRNRNLELQKLRRRLARSIVGTSQYMAPEVVRGRWYDGRCDWWSFGIILFECLYGHTPFCREDRDSTKAAILMHEHTFHFPYPPPKDKFCRRRHIGQTVQDLIMRLMQEPEVRLSSDRYVQNDYVAMGNGMWAHADKNSRDYAGRHVYADDAHDIKRHAFFTAVPWEYMHKMSPPWIPSFKSNDSITRWFDSEEEILASEMETPTTAAGPKGKALDGKSSDTILQTPELEQEMAAAAAAAAAKNKEKKQEKKRARDKLLRDPKTAETVMEARKKGAFLGYTYRRPKTWSLGDELRLTLPEMRALGY